MIIVGNISYRGNLGGQMLVLICSDITHAANSAQKLFTEHNIVSCAVEAEYKTVELDESYEGVGYSLNHHKKDGIQPSMVFKRGFKIYSSFIISHIDADTIFGIGWVSGLFSTNDEKLKSLSELIAKVDKNGIHNVSIPRELEKELQVIFSIVAEAKNKLSFLKYKYKYNITNIIKKAIMKIRDHIRDPKIMEKRYKLIKANLETIKLDKIYSTEKIHVFRNRMNDFLYGKHKFIINYSRGIVVYGRNDKITSEYFPKGLPTFIREFFGEAGGHFSAAGTNRNQRISNDDFNKFIEAFKLRIDNIDKNTSLLLEGEL